jgi:hypothetical protein
MLIITVQMALIAVAGLSLAAWTSLVISSTYHPWMFKPYGGFWEYLTIDWYPGIFLMAIILALLAVGLNNLYEPVEA